MTINVKSCGFCCSAQRVDYADPLMWERDRRKKKKRKEKETRKKEKEKKERESGDAVRSNNTHPQCVKATYTDQNHTYTLPCGDENEKAASKNTHDNT